MLSALFRLNNSNCTNLSDKVKAHICHCSQPVNTSLFFHMKNYVFDQVHLIIVQLKRIDNKLITLNHLACCKTDRNACPHCMVFNEMNNSMYATMNRAIVVILVTKILS